MKSFLKSVATQATAIILAALGAGLFAFIQSIAIQAGACDIPKANIAETSALGAMIKTAHSTFLYTKGIIKV